jgi:death-on-curing protein
VRYLTVALVLRIHERVIERTGGNPAIHDIGKIESAVAQPRMTFDGRPLYPTIVEKAAALGYSLNRNHGFQDGNKRTSHAAMELFLLRNGHEIDAHVDEQEQVFLLVAAGTMTREEFTGWLRSKVVRRRKRD